MVVTVFNDDALMLIVGVVVLVATAAVLADWLFSGRK